MEQKDISKMNREEIEKIVNEIYGDKCTSIYIKEKFIYIWFDGFYLKIRPNMINPCVLNCDAVGKISLMNMNKALKLMSELNKL